MRARSDAKLDAGLRSYMLRVYNHMAGGLALAGLVAYAAAASGFYEQITGTPLVWLVILAPFAFLLALTFGIDRMSAATTSFLFWCYAAIMGLSIAGASGSWFRSTSPSSLIRPSLTTKLMYGDGSGTSFLIRGHGSTRNVWGWSFSAAAA